MKTKYIDTVYFDGRYWFIAIAYDTWSVVCKVLEFNYSGSFKV
jgi:hypothetical protein